MSTASPSHVPSSRDAMQALLHTLDQWRSFRAIVVGDFMLDELVYGDAERLSPDAPVPVLLVRSRELRPGGASNVSMDLAALGAQVQVFGVTGADATAAALGRELAAQGVDTAGLVQDSQRPTTLKQSLIGLAQARHPQKMFRVDEESGEPIAESVHAELLRAISRAMPACDVVIIEDYGKGVCMDSFCQRVIGEARAHAKPVLVDPARNATPARYKGATAMTPNRNEAEQLTGMKLSSTHTGGEQERVIAHAQAMARAMISSMGLACAIVTLDRHGAVLQEAGGAAQTIPTRARQVYDVSGAGDMFIAGLAAARANACSWLDSVRFANAAAGLEVEVFGVQPIPFAQVRASLRREAGAQAGKLRTLEDAVAEAAERRARGQRVVFTNGCFDVLHSGHVSLLERAAACGDFLVVGLNCDESVRRLKGASRPVNNELDRARVLGALESVGCVVLFGSSQGGVPRAHNSTQSTTHSAAHDAMLDTPLALIEALRPDVLVKGADYTKDRVVGADVVERHGGRVELLALVEGKSTTNTIARMRV